MANLSLYATTFNCGRTLLDTHFFASNFFNALTTNLPPDLVVLSLQEIAPLGYSFVGGSLIAPYFARFGDAVRIAAEAKFGKDVEYETVVVRNVGLTGLMLFARRNVAEKIRWMRTGGVGVGVAEMGNKGAVGVRIGLEGREDEVEEVVLTFVAAHLAPMEEAWERRNEDWKSICEGLVFEKDGASAVASSTKDAGPESAPLLSSEDQDDDIKNAADSQQHTLFSPPTHLFFLGDLNYRTADTAPTTSSHKDWPQPTTSPSDQTHYTHLLASDQLTRECRANKTLHHLGEAPIAFPPTYKYSSAAQKHAAHAAAQKHPSSAPVSGNDDDDDEVWLWATHRVPSWCDRIFYLSSPQIHAYTALPVQPTSDHRPVALSCTIPFSPFKAGEELRAPFALRPDWAARRAQARRLELAVGMAAYLGWTWEGEALCVGTIVGFFGGWLVVRALVGAM